MKTLKPITNLPLLPFFIIFSVALVYCLGIPILCPDVEEQSLLNLKQSLKDPKMMLSSWESEVNCCKWEGVICSNFTGHVHQLHLASLHLSGKINPSLLNLKHLRHLDLSQNDFVGDTIPPFVGNFVHLEYLNLSGAGFHGIIPHAFGNLSSLRSLDIGGSENMLKSSIEWLSGLSQLEHLNMNGVNLGNATSWEQAINKLPRLLELHFAFCNLDSLNPLDFVNFTSLTFLDLSHNKFQSMPTWIFKLLSLRFLDLSWNYLEGPIPSFNNATKLHFVDLSRNSLNSTIPDWLYFSKELEFIHLSDNFLYGGLSKAVANLTSLKTFDIFGNRISGKIPREITNMCKLQFLFLTYNEFEGDVSDSFGNMSECFLTSIILLCVRSNRLSGHITGPFGDFKRIKYLHLGGNSFSGAVPTSLGKLSSLEELSLYGNKFTGNLPVVFGQLSNLKYLYIDGMKLEGIITDSHFANLTKLKTFSASGNHLTFNVTSNWVPPFQLNILTLGSWNLGRIPSWLETQKNVSELDLSDTQISGTVPSWFWKIQFLNISHNHLHGNIPYLRGSSIYLSSNQFSGLLPRVASTVKELDVFNNSFSGGISHFLCDRTYQSYGLNILHMGGNRLSGELPDCWMKWPSLIYLNLGNNMMSGRIPKSIGHLSNLRSLNLYGNRLSGEMPISMLNCTNLEKIELSDNDIDGTLPRWMGTCLIKLKFLVLRSNKMSGVVSPEICHLSNLQILDLSDNKLSGTIPRCVSNFTAMAMKRSLSSTSYSFRTFFIDSALVATKGSELHYDTILSLVTNIDLSNNHFSGDIPEEFTSLLELRSLNLSANQLTGFIPDNMGDMKQLESLDLSRNSLSGQIPSSFSRMSSLSHLNVSFNKLTGRIPESTQLLGFNASSFTGNHLCGLPLASDCSYGNEHKEENEDDDTSEINLFYVFLYSGYAAGLSVFCTTLVLNKSWRDFYFLLLDSMWTKLTKLLGTCFRG